MNGFTRFIFGIKPAPWADGGDWHLGWLALPKHDGLFLLAAGIVAVTVLAWLLYRWEARGLGWPLRFAFVVLRMAVLLGVLSMLLEPIVIFSKTEQEPSNLLVLVDKSDSMTLAEPYQDATQAKALADALKLGKGPSELAEHNRGWLAERALDSGLKDQLTAGGDRVVRIQDFAQQLLTSPPLVGGGGGRGPAGVDGNSTQPANSIEHNGDPSPHPASRDSPQGEGEQSSTAIGTSLRQAIAAYRGQPLAGVLLLTDGQSNAGEAVNKAADFAAAEGVPVVSVAIGTPEGPRNAKVVKVDANPVVFVKDPNRLRVLIESRGMAHAPATLVLDKRRDGGVWEEAARQSITLEDAGRVLEVPFDFKEDRPAKLDFRARLIDAGVELTEADNVATAEVRVIRQKIRVLFIAGSTFPEVEFIRNALLRDTGISASTWLQTADAQYTHPGNPSIRRLPTTAEELNDFDAIVLYDPDPTLWPSDYPKLLTDFVADAGGGLVYIAGERNTKNLFEHPDDPSVSWLSLLPVVSEPGLYQTDVSVQLSSREPWKLEITPEGKADPVFQFSTKADDNDTILANLPGMFWHFPVTRAKSGATVLARHADPRMRNENGQHVLLATQLVGPGRTFFIGFDSTYRWRYLDEQYFDGFWGRVIDRAGRNKQLGGRYPFTLTTDRTGYRPGTPVTLTARFDHLTDKDSGMDMMHGEVEVTDHAPIPITLTPKTGEPGAFETTFDAAEPGQYFVRVWPGNADVNNANGGAGNPTDSKGPRAATMQFDVELPSAEFEHPTLDRAGLEALAKATGGGVVNLEDFAKAAEMFKTRRVAHVLEDRQEIWDAPAIFGTVLMALFAEWLLRKKYRMV